MSIIRYPRKNAMYLIRVKSEFREGMKIHDNIIMDLSGMNQDLSIKTRLMLSLQVYACTRLFYWQLT